MSILGLVSNPEFWSALAGAMAAFLLGALATWRAADNAKRTAGNLTLIVLSQMYSLMENMHRHLFVKEPHRAAGLLGRPPFEFELRAAVGLPDPRLRIQADQLGFLMDSHDPDVLNRLMLMDRAFASMLDLIWLHERLHRVLQDKISSVDHGRDLVVPARDIPKIVGMHLILQIVDTVRGLQAGLPQTRDDLMAVSRQLRDALRFQFPTRTFIQFIPEARDRPINELPNFTRVAWWRRIVRWTVGKLARLSGEKVTAAAALADAQKPQPKLPEIARYYPPGMGPP